MRISGNRNPTIIRDDDAQIDDVSGKKNPAMHAGERMKDYE